MQLQRRKGTQVIFRRSDLHPVQDGDIHSAVFRGRERYHRRRAVGGDLEASSPALIEKVRSVVTDSGGQHRIVDLRPGTYEVTFTLPGFATMRREGIALTTGFTAAVNVELRVGEVSESITVSGEHPWSIFKTPSGSR